MFRVQADPTRAGGKAGMVLRHARKLHDHCKGYWLDQRLSREGLKIHYAIDTDVISAYLDPQAKKKMGALFTEDVQLAEILTRMLGEFVFFNLSSVPSTELPLGSLLVITPHDEEMDFMLIRLQEELARQVHNTWDDLKKVLALIDQEATNEEIAEVLLQNAALFVGLAGSGSAPSGTAVDKIERFSRIPLLRLMNTLAYTDNDGASVFAFPSPPKDPTRPGFRDFLRHYSKWKIALLARKVKGKSALAIDRDAKVLATLEWTNANIKDSRRRLVLITGSQSLLDAAETVITDVADSGGKPTFARTYLRHPQAFLGDEKFFLLRDKDEQASTRPALRVPDWLNLFFPGGVDTTATSNVAERQKAVTLPQPKPDAWRGLPRHSRQVSASSDIRPADPVTAVIEEWTEQVRTVAVERRVLQAMESPRSAAAQVIEKVRQQVRTGWSVEDFWTLLSSKTIRTLAVLYGSTSFLSIFALREEGTQILGVPALRFDRPYEIAQKFCSEMQNDMFEESAKLDLPKMYIALMKDDAVGYHALVVHAFAYAIRGFWVGTRILCLTAIDVVDAIPEEEKGDRYGREAAYLLAVAERRLARTRQDLERSRHYLREARERGARLPPDEPRFNRDRSGNDPRFDSEQLANEVAVVNLQYFVESGQKELAARAAEKLLKDKIPAAQRILASLAKMQASDKERVPGSVEAWVVRQLFTNVVGLALIAEMEYAESTKIYLDSLLSLMKVFHEADLSPDSQSGWRDAVSDVVYWAALAVYSPIPKDRRRAAASLRTVNPSKYQLEVERVVAFRELGMIRGRAGQDR